MGLAGGTQATGNRAFITLLNPSTSRPPVQATATFADASGQHLGTPRAVSVAAGTRQTIIVNTALGAHAVPVYSVLLTASGPIEAEQAQYWFSDRGLPDGRPCARRRRHAILAEYVPEPVPVARAISSSCRRSAARHPWYPSWLVRVLHHGHPDTRFPTQDYAPLPVSL